MKSSAGTLAKTDMSKNASLGWYADQLPSSLNQTSSSPHLIVSQKAAWQEGYHQVQGSHRGVTPTGGPSRGAAFLLPVPGMGAGGGHHQDLEGHLLFGLCEENLVPLVKKIFQAVMMIQVAPPAFKNLGLDGAGVRGS